MVLRENIKTAFNSIRRKKGRAVLTMLGIVIGIFAFILINSVGAGAQSLVLSQIEKIGSNLIGVLPGATEEKGLPVSLFGINITTLKEDDIKAVEKNVPSVVAASAYVRGSESITYKSNSKPLTFQGTSASYPEVEDVEIASGRYFTEEENNLVARVVVLGSGVVDEIFEDDEPLGASVRIKGAKYQVIGVLKERGAIGFESQDNTFLVPLNTAQKVILGIRNLSFARIKIDQAENVDHALENIRAVLREEHRIEDPKDDDFTVQSMANAIGVITSITDALRLFLTFIGAISLLVGGIGIMNIMYVSVSERTYEIGLRKAVGARNSHILMQFLIEAIVLTVLGGAIGMIFGILFSWLTAVVINFLGYNWDLVISIPSILIAFLISAGIGLIFGIYPARNASKKSPIEALLSKF